MEDLQSQTTGVNFFFGNQVWGVPTLAKTRDPADMLQDMYLAAADLHAKYWNDRSLLNTWVKGANWYNGEGRASWEIGVKVGYDYWKGAKKTIEDGTTKVKWSNKLIKVIDASFENASWENLQKGLKELPFTLTHGDFHASNMVWRFNDTKVSTLKPT
jgi:hypothetical protein